MKHSRQQLYILLSTAFLMLLSTICLSAQKPEEGIASYYHGRFHGKTTASGVIHKSDDLVAAHKSYPFGTRLLVTNLDNMQQVIVIVTDRGPFGKGRIIDVSREAAEQLGFTDKGVTRVRVEPIPDGLDLSYLDILDSGIPFIESRTLSTTVPLRLKVIDVGKQIEDKQIILGKE